MPISASAARPAFRVVQRVADDVQQQRRGERFRQHVFDADLPRLVGDLLAPGADHQDDARRRVEPQRVDLGGGLETVEIRPSRNRAGPARRARRAASPLGDRRHRLARRSRPCRRQSPCRSASRRRHRGRARWSSTTSTGRPRKAGSRAAIRAAGALAEPGGKPERAADPLGAVDADLAAHRLGEAACRSPDRARCRRTGG